MLIFECLIKELKSVFYTNKSFVKSLNYKRVSRQRNMLKSQTVVIDQMIRMSWEEMRLKNAGASF